MPIQHIITIDPEIMGGTPVFTGSRVPITALFDYLEAGDPLERFLDHFPSVERAQAVALLVAAEKSIVQLFLTAQEAPSMTSEA